MKKKKMVIAVLIIFVLLGVLCAKSFAADSFSASMTPSSTRVTKGGEVTVTVKLSGINVEGGISVVDAILKFDSDILSLEESDVNGLNGWSAQYNEDNSKLVFDAANAVTSDTEIATMKFKVSNSTSALTAAIRLVSVSGANAGLDDTISIRDITTNISLGGSTSSPTTSPSGNNSVNTNATLDPTAASPTSNNQVRTPSTSPIVTQPVTTTNTPVPTSDAPKNTTTNDNIPKTGADGYVIPLMAFIATLGIISFVNYKKISDK